MIKYVAQFGMLARTVGRALARGRAADIPKHPKRVCIIQLAKLGDMVCTTPLFAAARRALPDAELVVVGQRPNDQLMAGHPAIDRFVVWQGGAAAMARRLRELASDMVIIATPGSDALAAAYVGGVPAIICPRVEEGTSPYETLLYRLLRPLAIAVPHRMHHYAPGEYLKLLEPLGIHATDTTKTLAVDEEVQKAVDARLAVHTGKKVAIAPGAGNKIKEWPPERFNQVAAWLCERGATVFVIGASADKELGTIVEKGLPRAQVVNTVGALSVEELKALVRRMDLFVSADTGPIYIAEAFGVPTVDIVGPVDEREQPPQGTKHVVVVPKREKPELFVMDARSHDKQEARRQAEGVSVEQALEAIQTLHALHVIG